MCTSTYPNKEVDDSEAHWFIFSDGNINAEIVQVSATQKLVVFLEHKGIGTGRTKTEQVKKCRDG